jgi:hypothetical protein
VSASDSPLYTARQVSRGHKYEVGDTAFLVEPREGESAAVVAVDATSRTDLWRQAIIGDKIWVVRLPESIAVVAWLTLR